MSYSYLIGKSNVEIIAPETTDGVMLVKIPIAIRGVRRDLTYAFNIKDFLDRGIDKETIRQSGALGKVVDEF